MTQTPRKSLTVRVNGEVQSTETLGDLKSTETLGDLITCHGCKAVGHVLESCPENQGLTYTDCQMFQMKQTNASAKKKPTSPGIDQLSSRFQKLANETNLPASPINTTLNIANTNTVRGPDTTPQKTVEKITPPQQTNTPTIVQSDRTNTAKRLLSSLGIPTKPDAPQIDPSTEVPKKIPVKNKKASGKRNGEREVNQT